MVEDFIKNESAMNWPGHSYLLCGQVSKIKNYIESFFRQQSDFEVFSEEYSTFGIDDVHYISRFQMLGGKNRKVFILAIHKFTKEAQNAFLKTLEESRNESLFLLIVSSESVVLPTLKSRCQVFNFFLNKEIIDAKEFVEMSVADRLESIANMIEKTEEEGHRIKQKEKVISLLNGLEQILQKDVYKNKKTLEEIFVVRKYLNDTSASFKLLLEHLAVIL